MSPQSSPAAPTESPQSLRDALMAPPTPARPTAAVPPRPAAEAGITPADKALLPTAAELLASSSNLQRLCDSYHSTRRNMVRRGRRQRLGIAALVCVLGVAAVALFRQGSLADTTATLLVVSVAVASCAGLGVLATLWLREDRALRQAQGERLLRALQFNCSLPEDNLLAFRRLVPPQQAFFDVYGAWKMENPERAGGLTALLHSGKKTRRASA